ncbi:MAG TPA: hypothetical protein VFW28_02230 [Micropepsaceae bacterium]|nr:hypothetical protein [Micropepsaceae bacterium]
MRKSGFAISALLGAVTCTATAFAAPAQNTGPAATVFAPSASTLGSWLMSGFDQTPNKPSSFQFGQSPGWAPGTELFPAASSLNALALSATAVRSSAAFALAPGLTFGVSYTAFQLGTADSAFSQPLALRLAPSLANTGTTTANISWNLTDWSTVGITASHSTGNPLLLGSVGSPLAAGPTPENSALGISARVGFAEGWVTTLAYSEGISQLDLSQMAATNAVRSDAYQIGLAKTGLFGNDALGIALSRPPQIYGVTGFGAMVNNFALSTAPARESDVELGYVTSFLDGTLALQANAAYEVNPAGVRGQNALAAVARAKLNF